MFQADQFEDAFEVHQVPGCFWGQDHNCCLIHVRGERQRVVVVVVVVSKEKGVVLGK